MSRRKAVMLQVLVAILFSTAGLLIKVVQVNPLALAGIRSLIAAAVIGLYMAWRASRQPRPRAELHSWSSALASVTPAQMGGALALVGAQLFFVLATRQTTAANAVFIQYTAPLYVAIFGIWFLGERVTRRDWLAMAAIGLGLYLFFHGDLRGGAARSLLGNAYALLSGLSLAWFVLFLRRERDRSTVRVVLLGNVLMALIGLPFAWGQSFTPSDWGGLLFLGLFQLGLPFVILSVSIRYLTAVETILIQTLEPILNPIWVFLFLGEVPVVTALAGGVVVLGAVTARSLMARRRPPAALSTGAS